MVKVAGFIFFNTQQTAKLCIGHSFFGKLKQTLSKKQQENVFANLTSESVIEEADP